MINIIEFNDKYTFKLEKISGIYLIRNTQTNYIYIGESLDIKSRWRQHIEELKSNTHHNKDMQYDYDIYDLSSFDFKLLQTHISESTTKTKVDIILLENWWINYYKEKGYKLYNIYNTLDMIINNNIYRDNSKIDMVICKYVRKKLKTHSIHLIDGMPMLINNNDIKRAIDEQSKQEDNSVTQLNLLKELKNKNLISQDCDPVKFRLKLEDLGYIQQNMINSYIPTGSYLESISINNSFTIKFTKELADEIINKFKEIS